MDSKMQTEIDNVIEYHGDPKQIAKMLDEVMWGYAIYLLKDSEACEERYSADALYWCKQLRDCFNA